MSPSVRNWGKKMCMKLTCTGSTIILWVRPRINFRRRRNQTPPFRWSRQADTLLYNWWCLISSASKKNLSNTPWGLYAYLPGYYTTPSSIQTRTRPITCSGFGMHRSSMRHVMGASYQGESNNTGWRYYIHYMSLVLILFQEMRRRRQKHH